MCLQKYLYPNGQLEFTIKSAGSEIKSNEKEENIVDKNLILQFFDQRKESGVLAQLIPDF